MTPEQTLDWLAEQHKSQCNEDRPVQEWIRSMKSMLPAPVQEPRCAVIVEVFGTDWRLDYMSLPVGKHKLYTQQYIYTTPPAQPAPVQEPEKRECMNCAAFGECNPNNDAGRCGYEPPKAQRQWDGLADGEIKRIGKLDFDSDYFGLWYDFAKNIEAKLKEKNGV